MARRPARRNSSNQGNNSWLLLLTGIVLGLILAWLIYLVFEDRPDDKNSGKAAPAVEEKKSGQNDNNLPQFEFYSILPELEVVIPEQFTESLREVLPVEAEEPTDQPQPEPTPEKQEQIAQGKTYFIQAGSFRKQEDAERMKVKLILLGLDVQINPVQVENNRYHRVRVGPFKNYGAFETATQRLRENNIKYIVLQARQ